MAPTRKGNHVRGSLCTQDDVIGPEEERGCTSGSLPVKADVHGPEGEQGCTNGSLHAEVDVLGPGQERQVEKRSCPPPYPTVDWDSMARVGMT